MAKSADWDQARSLCSPEHYGTPEWRDHYAAHPDVLAQMLGDVYRVYKSEEAKKNGTANPQGGRRRAHIDGNLDELWSIITPVFATEPFAKALDARRGKRSYSQIAQRAGMDRRRLSGLMGRHRASTAVLTREELEALARALDVHPAYFMEWRSLVIRELLDDVLAQQPHLSVRLIKQLSGG